MIPVTKTFYVIFGILVLVGGWLGFRQARSVASLVVGILCGVMLFGAAAVIDSILNLGLVLGLTVSVVLLGKFLPDMLQQKSKPHVHLAVFLSGTGVILTILTWYYQR